MAFSFSKVSENNELKESFGLDSPKFKFLVSVSIVLSIVAVTILHFLTPLDQVVWHEIYQRLYYIPIIASALLFGLRGGLAASIFTSIVYFPHVYLHWQHQYFDYSINQYAEMIIFNLVGGIMGALGDKLRQARLRAERNAIERQKAYEELQKTYEELQRTFEELLQAEKLSSLGELSAGIVHEVRNPLSSIKGAIEILEDEIKPDSPRREFALLAKREIERLDKLVGEFLRFARPSRSNVRPSDLNEIIESVVSLIESKAAKQKVIIEKELTEKLPSVLVDAEQIKQVLLNLSINSLQAMPNGGKLIFRTFRSDNACIVQVEDTGHGINDEILPKIFDPFFTTKEKGIGLGLSIAHKIVTQHGGVLKIVKNKPGTIFQLQLKSS